MEELMKIYHRRLDVFRGTSDIVSKDLLNYRYGQLYGILDSMRILGVISFNEYQNLISDIDEIYSNSLYINKQEG